MWGVLSVPLGSGAVGWVVWMIIGMIRPGTHKHQKPNLARWQLAHGVPDPGHDPQAVVVANRLS